MANRDFWSPQLESKLHAWHQIQLIADQKKPAPCFTIAREFGCQAYPLAEKLVQRLNATIAGEPWVVVGREILDEVAKLSGYSVDQIEKSQDTPSSLKAIFSMFLDKSLAEETEVFAHMHSVIRGFAKRGNCVLVGRGAVYASKDLPNCIHLRLVAPYEFRVRKIMASHQLSQSEAEAFIELHQKQRDDFIKRFAKDDHPEDATRYHMVFNNSLVSLEDMVELLEEYMIKIHS